MIWVICLYRLVIIVLVLNHWSECCCDWDLICATVLVHIAWQTVDTDVEQFRTNIVIYSCCLMNSAELWIQIEPDTGPTGTKQGAELNHIVDLELEPMSVLIWWSRYLFDFQRKTVRVPILNELWCSEILIDWYWEYGSILELYLKQRFLSREVANQMLCGETVQLQLLSHEWTIQIHLILMWSYFFRVLWGDDDAWHFLGLEKKWI